MKPSNKSLQATPINSIASRQRDGVSSSVPQCGTDDVIRPACLSSGR